MVTKTLKDLAKFTSFHLPKKWGGELSNASIITDFVHKDNPKIDPNSKLFKYLVAKRLAKAVPPYTHLIPKLDKMIENERKRVQGASDEPT